VAAFGFDSRPEVSGAETAIFLSAGNLCRVIFELSKKLMSWMPNPKGCSQLEDSQARVHGRSIAAHSIPSQMIHGSGKDSQDLREHSTCHQLVVNSVAWADAGPIAPVAAA
jgi:hypothetical protein